MKNHITPLMTLSLIVVASIMPDAKALPAFALKEGVSCNVCHTNGSAPHLTKLGFIYRRAGFRFPGDIGNVEKETANLNLLHHLAAGMNVDYNVQKSHPTGDKETLDTNGIGVREVEIWPLVGSFYGNYGVWTEIDSSPNTVSPRSTPTAPGQTTAPQGGVALSLADLRYVTGTPDLFYSLRAGLIAPEGYGASDQWVDDGGIPFMDLLTPYLNQDTLAAPHGAMNSPQMGAELGLSLPNTYLTLGSYGGFDGTNGYAGNTASTATPQQTNADSASSKDYKIQLDQFLFNDRFEFTAVHYDGRISLLEPQSNQMVWQDHYQQDRLYLTYIAAPGVVDLFAGAATGENQYVNPGTTDVAGTFQSTGQFVGLNWYALNHLTVSGHVDKFVFNNEVAGIPSESANGGTLMLSVPYQNNMFIFHYTRIDSGQTSGPAITGTIDDFRLEWRFLF